MSFYLPNATLSEHNVPDKPHEHQVIIYKAPNFDHKNRRAEACEGYIDFNMIWKDTIKSMQVGSGLEVFLYADTQLRGNRLQITDHNCSDIQFANPRCQFNIRRANKDTKPQAGEVVLYEHINWEGRALVLPKRACLPDLDAINFRNTVSGLKVGAGMKVLFYSKPNWEGEAKEFKAGEYQDFTKLGYNDKPASVKIMDEAMQC